MRKGITLAHLSEMIHKKLDTVGRDIEPDYHPHTSEMRETTKMCLIVLMSKKDETSTRPKSSCAPLKLFKQDFPALVDFIANDIDKNGYISFYHYLGLLTALSHHYADCIKEGKNKTVNLADSKNWEDPTHDMAVMTLYFIAGLLFKIPLQEHSEIFGASDAQITDIIAYTKYHIDKMN
jgi:hypothetical protein